MSAETQEALHEAMRGYIPGTDAGLEEMVTAAEAHLASARPYEEVAAGYVPLLEPDATPSTGEFAELAEELHAIRLAQAVIAGALPGGPPAVTTEG